MTFAEKFAVKTWTEYYSNNITSRFVWKQNSITEFFKKRHNFKGFDSQSVLILGGYNHAKMMDSSEVFFANDSCHVPNLPNGENPGNSLVLTAGDHKVKDGLILGVNPLANYKRTLLFTFFGASQKWPSDCSLFETQSIIILKKNL